MFCCLQNNTMYLPTPTPRKRRISLVEFLFKPFCEDTGALATYFDSMRVKQYPRINNFWAVFKP